MRISAVVLLAVLLAPPALAQPWEGYYETTDVRDGAMLVLVLDPDGEGRTRYRFLALADLLRGAIDLRERFAAAKTAGPATEAPPAFGAGDFLAGSSASGLNIPAPPLPDGASAVWLAVAEPAGSAGSVSVGAQGNVTEIFRPGGAVELNGRDYVVRVGWIMAPLVRGRVAFGGAQ